MASGLPVPDPGIEALGAGTALYLQANQFLDQRGDVAPHCSLIRQLQAFDSEESISETGGVGSNNCVLPNRLPRTAFHEHIEDRGSYGHAEPNEWLVQLPELRGKREATGLAISLQQVGPPQGGFQRALELRAAHLRSP